MQVAKARALDKDAALQVDEAGLVHHEIDGVALADDVVEPVAKLRRIADRGAEGQKAARGRQEADEALEGSCPLGAVEAVHLVENGVVVLEADALGHRRLERRGRADDDVVRERHVGERGHDERDRFFEARHHRGDLPREGLSRQHKEHPDAAGAHERADDRLSARCGRGDQG